MSALFEVIDQYHADLAQLQELDLPNEVVLDTIESMQGPVEQKVRAVVAYALKIKADAATRKEHAKRMSEGAKAMENRYESLMMYAQIGLMNSGLKLPLTLPEFTLNIAKNPPSLMDEVDPMKVPDQYLRRTITVEVPVSWSEADVREVIEHADGKGAVSNCSVAVDRRGLLDAVKADPEGCKPFARLNPQSYRLSVK